MPTNTGSHEIRIAEALYRSEAHCVAASHLWAAGRGPDALLQAARPMTDVFPWLETELRSSPEKLKRFMGAVAAVGREVRQGSSPREIRRSLKEVSKAREALMKDAAGPNASTGRFVASVAVALLRSVAQQYSRAVSDQDLGGYHTAYALVHAARDLLVSAGADGVADLRDDMTGLESAFPSAQPPPFLARPEHVEAIVERIAGLPPWYPQGVGQCADLDMDIGAAPNIFTAGGRKLVGVGQKSGIYHVARADSMKRAWTSLLGVPSAVGGIVGSTAYDGHAIYGPHTLGGYLWSVDKKGGSYRWLTPVGDGAHYGNPVAVANGVVYTVDLKGAFNAYDSATGAPLLTYPMFADAENLTASWGGVSVARNTVYAAVGITGLPDGFVVAFRPQ